MSEELKKVVKVKALEWNGPNTLVDGQKVWAAIAEGMEFTYSIWTHGVGYERRFFCAKVLPQLFDSLDEAKAAVQQNYDDRILSAIVLMEVTPDGEPIDEVE